jgi:hypothetical protein
MPSGEGTASFSQSKDTITLPYAFLLCINANALPLLSNTGGIDVSINTLSAFIS